MTKSISDLLAKIALLNKSNDDLGKENEQLKLQLAQAKAAISIVDPATGTGAFLGNPPYGVKDGEG